MSMEQAIVVLNDVSRLRDDELVAGLHRLARADRALTARMLVHLGEVDARKLYRERAWPSMFSYLVEELHMTEAEACLRIQSARLGRQFPLIVELIGQSALHLSAIKLLAPHLTQANHVALLERARGMSKRGVELLVAEIAPKPDVPSRMRKLPERFAACADQPTTGVATRGEQGSIADATRAEQMSTPAKPIAPLSDRRRPFELTAPPPRRASSVPLSPGRYKVELTAGQVLHDKLEQLKNLMRHQVPDGDLAIVLERAADVLIDKLMKERFGLGAKTPRVKRPRVRKRKARVRTREVRSRYVRRAVVREVYERDGGQCAFVSPDGRRCSERGFLELHHEMPFARGGPTTADNLRIICKAHNALFAARDYGEGFMQAKLVEAREQRQRARGTPVPEPTTT
jgi:5-methylcytosine-specific restriction endonuclease McrA